MKLCRYGKDGYEKPGLIDPAGKLRDLSKVIQGIDARALSTGVLKKLARVKPESLPLVTGSPRFGVPYTGISKYVAIGLNYSDHAAEAGMAVPSEPIIFMKATTCICGPTDDTIQPRSSTKLDWEVELAVVIGRRAQYVSEDEALDHVAGYCVANDVSERAFQLQSSQWDKGKGCDTFGPIGPWLVTADEVPDPQNLDMWLDVNGERMQSGNTHTMIFGVKKLISYCSHYMTLLPGDVIATGTPPGVGMGKKPNPIWLKPGDVVTLGIEGLGEQRQKIVGSGG
ncbi:MAG: 2-hydroxyhepta-2,4-diene,7-dioate isomerase [Betaproteobacteria bacterium]|jgi:2,4-diketo-3-deoxy-L-fuconate hydrolase|nr:2-hydroxyhepta-2,4-diene,7-dioate isomerase [Betaproteobacteria bacterium]